MSNCKSDYQWKFEYSCVAIVFLIVGLLFSWTQCNKAESRADELERQIESIESEYYDRGYADGRRDGYDIGYDEGRSDGSQKYYGDGYDDGYLYGYAFGMKDSISGAIKDMDSFTKQFLLELADEENRGKPF